LGALAVTIESKFEPGEEQLQDALQTGDTLGGRVSLTIQGLPGGIGSYVHWERRLDSRLAGALMSLPGVKGVEFGLGFAGTALPGSRYHDQFHKTPQGFCRLTNNAGGIEGGVSNGEAVEVSLAVKPIPTQAHPLASFCLKTGEAAPAPVSRHDLSAVPALAVIARAVAAWEVAEALISQFGGASFATLEASFRRQRQYWRELCYDRD
jgi:chorismate synthase